MKPTKQKITNESEKKAVPSEISIQNQALEKIARGLTAKSGKKDPQSPGKRKK